MEQESAIPVVTGRQMAEVDRVMAEALGLDVLQVMELAGMAVAAFARERFLGGDPRGKRVAVLAGSGGNGGDGMVAARHLHGWGAEVVVWLGRRPAPGRGAASHQLAILDRLGIPARDAALGVALPGVDLLIDALLGFSLAGAPAGAVAGSIEAANRHPAPVLAVDVPSGLDATDGTVREPCIRAEATLTLGLPKTGLLTAAGRGVAGEIVVADIGIPREAYARIGVEVGPIFAASRWRALDDGAGGT